MVKSNAKLLATLCFVFALLFPAGKTQGLPDGADLFVEAVRCRTANHTIVHSLTYVAEQTYRIDKSSVNINFPITDKEFALEIPGGATIIDARKGKGPRRITGTAIRFNDAR